MPLRRGVFGFELECVADIGVGSGEVVCLEIDAGEDKIGSCVGM